MQRREQLLLGGLLSAVAIWSFGGAVKNAIFEPFETRSAELSRLEELVTEKDGQRQALERARRSLTGWKAMSLPIDAGKSKQPTALDAQRLYLQWVTDLAQLCEFEDPKIRPGGQPQLKPNSYLSVAIKVDADVSYNQLVRFLDLFYRTDLLHRISSLHVTTKVFERDAKLSVSLEAEGLVLLDAAPRRTLFPETELTSELSEDGTTLQVGNASEFPKKADFRIQIQNEFLTVTTIDGKNWTVDRAVDQTRSASYPIGASIELVPLIPNQKVRTLDDFRAMIEANIFAKPAPPYKMQLGPLGEKSFARGKPIEFSIPVKGFDKQKGNPEFAIVGDAPEGLKLDKSGKVTWKPTPEVSLGKYPVKFEVKHPSAPQGHLAETMTIRLREGAAAPKLAASKPIRVYLNREWKYKPELQSSELPPKLNWKLGEKSPQGLKIDEKSGELKWTPGDAVPIGETVIPLIASDGESPPQSTTLSLKIDVQDDAAQFTQLTGIVSLGNKKSGYVIDKSTDKKTELHEGDKFAVSDISCTVTRIGNKFVLMNTGQQEIRWEIGKSLREAKDNFKDY